MAEVLYSTPYGVQYNTCIPRLRSSDHKYLYVLYISIHCSKYSDKPRAQLLSKLFKNLIRLLRRVMIRELKDGQSVCEIRIGAPFFIFVVVATTSAFLLGPQVFVCIYIRKHGFVGSGFLRSIPRMVKLNESLALMSYCRPWNPVLGENIFLFLILSVLLFGPERDLSSAFQST